MPSNIVFLRASKLVSTKTLLLKHDYRRQGREAKLKKSSFQYGMTFSIANGLFHSEPLSGRRKTRPGIEIFNRE